MAGLDPAIHVFLLAKTWMPGTGPGMTVECHVKRALTTRLTDFAHSPASIFLPSAG